MNNTDLLKKLEEEISACKTKEAKLTGEVARLRERNRQLAEASYNSGIYPEPNIYDQVSSLRQFYENILDGIPAEITVLDPQKRYLYINPVTVRDKTLRGSLTGKTDFDYCNALGRPMIIAQNRSMLFDSAVYDREQKEWEEEWPREDGSIDHYLRRIYPVFDDSGSLYMMVGYGINITQRVWIEHELRTSEELYRTLVQEAKDYGIFMLNTEGMIITWNEGACRITGYTTAEATGKHLSIFHPPGTSASIAEQTLATALAEGKHEEEGWRIRKDGNRFWSNIIITPLYNFRHELVGFSKIMRDLTERKHAEELLRQARDKAESSSRAKQLFLANMSHEIRTPMNAIIGMSRILARESLPDKQQHFMNAILSSAQNLHTIIDDILDFSKMEAGHLNIRNAGFNPAELMQQQMGIFEFRAEEKGVRLRLDLDEALSPVLISDPVRINQVILNLAGNAIKFTEQGEICISVKVLKDTANTQQLRFGVKDTGIGIAQEKLPYIFDVFYQVNEPATEKYRGTGLGLSISRQLVELLGGEMFVESSKNEGTFIGFTICMQKGDVHDLLQSEAPIVSGTMLRGKIILLVEDNQLNRMLVTTLLEQQGATVNIAENGKQGIEKLQQGIYDLVLMDVSMPEMNGIEATRYIRQQLGSDVPVIAMTANVISGDAEECIRAGMNDYIPKPFGESELFMKICAQLGIDMQYTAPQHEQGTVEKKPVQPQQLYNKSKLTGISRGDDAFVRHMMATFIAHMQQTMRELNEACAQENIRSIRNIAHKARPGITDICGAELVEIITAIELLGDREVFEGIPGLVKQFNQQIIPVIEQITLNEL
jgi:PAS domain S-box-containing protein